MAEQVYVESDFGGHIDDATQAWTFRLVHWGLCGQGSDEETALRSFGGRAFDAFRQFLGRHGESCPPLEEEIKVVERIHGDELAFQEDRRPASDDELARTLQILEWARSDLLELLAFATEEELDWDDPQREMPTWATWRTAQLMAWHVADTESRYYLAMLGVEPPPRPDGLFDWLERSARHVRSVLPGLPRDLMVEEAGQAWTTRKVLRRLAWHERGEVDAMRAHLEQARAALDSS